MKPISIVGIILALAGVVVLARGLTYNKQHDVVRVGDLRATVTEERTVPTWVGIAAVVGGVLLVAAGVQGNKK